VDGKLRVLVADDSAILREGLLGLLTRRGWLAQGVADGTALLSQLREISQSEPDAMPDVVVIDIRMPPTFTDEGLRAALEVRETYPGLPVLLFSQYVEAAYASKLLAGSPAGVGYLLKDRVADVGEFSAALQRLAAGETVLDPEVVSQLVRTSKPGSPLLRLTPREREVLELMAEGRSNAAIAAQLYLSAGAVEKNVAAIFQKLDLPQTGTENRRVLAVRQFLGI
jgi:DNA-binding NarL/FixJ family response regulator